MSSIIGHTSSLHPGESETEPVGVPAIKSQGISSISSNSCEMTYFSQSPSALREPLAQLYGTTSGADNIYPAGSSVILSPGLRSSVSSGCPVGFLDGLSSSSGDEPSIASGVYAGKVKLAPKKVVGPYVSPSRQRYLAAAKARLPHSSTGYPEGLVVVTSPLVSCDGDAASGASSGVGTLSGGNISYSDTSAGATVSHISGDGYTGSVIPTSKHKDAKYVSPSRQRFLAAKARASLNHSSVSEKGASSPISVTSTAATDSFVSTVCSREEFDDMVRRTVSVHTDVIRAALQAQFEAQFQRLQVDFQQRIQAIQVELQAQSKAQVRAEIQRIRSGVDGQISVFGDTIQKIEKSSSVQDVHLKALGMDNVAIRSELRDHMQRLQETATELSVTMKKTQDEMDHKLSTVVSELTSAENTVEDRVSMVNNRVYCLEVRMLTDGKRIPSIAQGWSGPKTRADALKDAEVLTSCLYVDYYYGIGLMDDGVCIPPSEYIKEVPYLCKHKGWIEVLRRYYIKPWMLAREPYEPDFNKGSTYQIDYETVKGYLGILGVLPEEE